MEMEKFLEVAVEKGFAASAEGGSQGGYEDWE